jgi:hypothetical protein
MYRRGQKRSWKPVEHRSSVCLLLPISALRYASRVIPDALLATPECVKDLSSDTHADGMDSAMPLLWVHFFVNIPPGDHFFRYGLRVSGKIGATAPHFP